MNNVLKDLAFKKKNSTEFEKAFSFTHSLTHSFQYHFLVEIT